MTHLILTSPNTPPAASTIRAAAPSLRLVTSRQWQPIRWHQDCSKFVRVITQSCWRTAMISAMSQPERLDFEEWLDTLYWENRLLPRRSFYCAECGHRETMVGGREQEPCPKCGVAMADVQIEGMGFDA